MKTIAATDFVPGRIYSVIYKSEVEMVQKRELPLSDVLDMGLVVGEKGKTANPFYDNTVEVRRVWSVQAAGNKTWTNFLGKTGEEPAGKEPSWTVSDYNSCIVVGKKDGAEKLRALPRNITKSEYFIDKRPATDAEVAIIRAFKKNKGHAPFVTLNLSKLENVLSVEGEAE
jgi:hypothetical protein